MLMVSFMFRPIYPSQFAHCDGGCVGLSDRLDTDNVGSHLNIHKHRGVQCREARCDVGWVCDKEWLSFATESNDQ